MLSKKKKKKHVKNYTSTLRSKVESHDTNFEFVKHAQLLEFDENDKSKKDQPKK